MHCPVTFPGSRHRFFATFLDFAYLSRSSLFGYRICLVTSRFFRPQSIKRSHYPSPSLLRSIYGCRNLFLPFSIHYAFRPRVRSRLTQGTNLPPGIPWAFGVVGFSPTSRYSHRHSHFYTIHRAPHGTASARIQRSPTK